jgi:3-deoxy-manno-octulosonate cytidylyltransferase (CMP-KDO synthetase)
MTEIRFKVVIPTRYAATRLPGKPLRIIAGRPMIEYVYHQALASGAEEVLIATDDARIRNAAQAFGAKVCMTAAEHPSGTDRLAEVVEQRNWTDNDIIVNLQGDEPLMPPALIQRVAEDLKEHSQAGIATLCTRIASVREVFDAHVVKVVRDVQGYALYFSRAPIPYNREAFAESHSLSQLPEGYDYFRHIGLYAYRVATLKRFPQLPTCRLERAESLEQLRALWNGIRIHVSEVTAVPPLGVDTERDLARVEAYLAGES